MRAYFAKSASRRAARSRQGKLEPPILAAISISAFSASSALDRALTPSIALDNLGLKSLPAQLRYHRPWSAGRARSCPKNDQRTALDKDNNEHRLKLSSMCHTDTSRGGRFRLRCNRTLLRPADAVAFGDFTAHRFRFERDDVFQEFCTETNRGRPPLTRRDLTHRVTMKAETPARRP
jgi:hypothetical protein